MGKDVDKSTESVKEHRKEQVETERQTRKTSGALSRLIGSYRSYQKEVKDAKNETKGFHSSVSELNRNMMGLRNTISIIKWPALIAGAGLALGAISALVAGVAALLGPMGNLAGGAATLAQGFMAFKQAGAVAKFAMTGLGDGLKDLKKQFDAATPAGRKYVAFLKTFTPELLHLRNIAQGPILRGMTDGLKQAQGNLGRLSPIVRETANQIGGLATRAGALVGSKGFGQDFTRLGRTNVTLIGSMGNSALNLANALRHVLIPAQELTRWLGRLTEGWTQALEKSAAAGRETGTTAKFFDRTRLVMERLFSITGSLFVAFKNIAGAGRRLGFDILKALDNAAEGFERWTGSVKGQNQLKEYFDAARPVLFEAGRLVRDIVKAFFRLGNQPGLTDLLHQVRTQLLPVLEKVIGSTTKAFGPHLVNALTNVARLIGALAGASGPLTVYVDILGRLSGALADLLEQNPQMQSMVVNLVGFAAVWKGIAFAGKITGAKQLIGLLAKVAAGYKIAAGAEAAGGAAGGAKAGAAGVAAATKEKTGKAAGMATKAAGAIGGALTMISGPVAIVIAALVAIGIALVVLYKKSETFRDIVNGVWAAVKTAFGAAAAWITTAFQTVVTWLSTAFTTIKTFVTSLVDTVVNEVKQWSVLIWLVKGYWSVITTLFKTAVSQIVSIVKALLPVISGVFSVIMTVIKSSVRVIGTIIKSGFGVIAPIVRGVFGVVKAVISGAWTMIKGVIQGALNVIGGIIKVFGGVLKGDFGQMWEGVKQIFKGAVQAITGILRGASKAVGGAARSIGEAIRGSIEGAIQGVLNVVASAVNGIIDILNKIPGVDIGHVNAPQIGGKTRTATKSTGGIGQQLAQGGQVTSPTVIMGEEAPRHPEWVIPENPAYRKRAFGLWQAAGASIGAFAQGGRVPGNAQSSNSSVQTFGIGGFLKGAVRSIGGVASAVGDKTLNMMSAPIRGALQAAGSGLFNRLPGPLKGLADFILANAMDFGRKKSGGGKMMEAARGLAGRNLPYTYGGGHNASFSGSPGYDCSGAVSYVLGPDGARLISSPMTTDGLKTWGNSGDSDIATIGVRGSTGRSAHTMMSIGDTSGGGAGKFFESGSGHGPAFTNGWSGNFPIHRHPSTEVGLRKGGNTKYVSGSGIPGSIRRKIAMNPDALNPGGRGFLGYGLKKGGQVPAGGVAAAQAAYKAGFRGDALERMVAIAWRESRFNRQAKNFKYPDHSIGLWQINQLAHKGKYGSDAALTDPDTNARAAWKISGGGKNFSPWSTNAGLSADALAIGHAAVQAMSGGGAGKNSGTTAGTGSSTGGASTTGADAGPVARLNVTGQTMGRGRGSGGAMTAFDFGEAGTNTAASKAGRAAIAPLNASKAAIGIARSARTPYQALSAGARAGVGAKTADAIDFQEKIARDAYKDAAKEVSRLERKQARVGLGRTGRAKLQKAYEAQSSALSAMNDIRGNMQALNEEWGPEAELQMAQAQAAMTDTPADDVAVAKQAVNFYQGEYTQALKTKNPKKIAEAAQALTSAKQTLADLTPTESDYQAAAAAGASFTANIWDDIEAQQWAVNIAQREYSAAVAGGDPRRIAQAASNLKSAQDNLRQLTPQPEDYLNLALVTARGTKNIWDDVSVLQQQLNLAAQRLNESYATNDPRQVAEALGNYQSAQQAVQDAIPTAYDYADLLLAQAEATKDDPADDIAALQAILAARQKEYADSLLTNDPRQIAAALRAQTAAQEAVDNAGGGVATAISFADRIGDDVISGLGGMGPDGQPNGNVTVKQYFRNPPSDPYAYLRQAEYASRSVFSS